VVVIVREDSEEPKIRAVAKVVAPGRGVARVSSTREETNKIPMPGSEQLPVFVDDSGRRGRWVTWLALGIAVLGLALVMALWFSQASSTGG
jgi:hypothetical protein